MLRRRPEVVSGLGPASGSTATGRARQTIVIGGGRPYAVLRLTVWVALVCVFYVGLLQSSGWREGGAASAIALALLPLLTLNYPLAAFRELRTRRTWTFDGRERVLRLGERTVARFADVRRVRLRAVNGSCEELALFVQLSSGREIRIAEGGARARLQARGVEVARLIGVGLARGA